jgi:FkbM family methyltransferase
MKTRSLISRLASALYKLDARKTSQLGREIQIIQGLGYGTSSVFEEANQAISKLDHIKDNLIVFDVGANKGLYSDAIIELAPHARVFAFEPNEFSYSKLSERFFGNQKVQAINLAFGQRKELRKLWFDEPGSGMASLTKRKLDHFGISFSRHETVHVETLDNWCGQNGIFPSLLKLDVEGHEFDVLRGGIQTLQMTQVVQFEFGGCNIDTRTYFQDFWYFFTEHGFSLFRITPGGLIQLSGYLEEFEHFQTTNYLAVNNRNLDN